MFTGPASGWQPLICVVLESFLYVFVVSDVGVSVKVVLWFEGVENGESVRLARKFPVIKSIGPLKIACEER